MKKIILISLIPVLAIILFVAAQIPVSGPLVEPVAEDLDLGWPDEVMTLLERSCFDCHSSESGNIKAKGKLNFSKWEDYKTTKKIIEINDNVIEIDKIDALPDTPVVDLKPFIPQFEAKNAVVPEWLRDGT